MERDLGTKRPRLPRPRLGAGIPDAGHLRAAGSPLPVCSRRNVGRSDSAAGTQEKAQVTPEGAIRAAIGRAQPMKPETMPAGPGGGDPGQAAFLAGARPCQPQPCVVQACGGVRPTSRRGNAGPAGSSDTDRRAAWKRPGLPWPGRRRGRVWVDHVPPPLATEWPPFKHMCAVGACAISSASAE